MTSQTSGLTTSVVACADPSLQPASRPPAMSAPATLPSSVAFFMITPPDSVARVGSRTDPSPARSWRVSAISARCVVGVVEPAVHVDRARDPGICAHVRVDSDRLAGTGVLDPFAPATGIVAGAECHVVGTDADAGRTAPVDA